MNELSASSKNLPGGSLGSLTTLERKPLPGIQIQSMNKPIKNPKPTMNPVVIISTESEIEKEDIYIDELTESKDHQDVQNNFDSPCREVTINKYCRNYQFMNSV